MHRVTVPALYLLMVIFLAACNSRIGSDYLSPVLASTLPSTLTPPATATLPATSTALPVTLATPIGLTGDQSDALQGQSPLFDQEKLGTVERNVTYCLMGAGKYPVPMDVYYPRTMNGPWPVVINVHGGAWALNNQLNGQGLQIQPELNARGFLVVSVDYRNATQWRWPAMIEDVKCAVRSLRAHAQVYNLDPNQIGAVGDSVGGQLVLLLALTNPTTGWDVDDYLEYSSQVQAVVDFFGLTDLTSGSLLPLIKEWGLREFGDIRYVSPVLVAASPITYVNPYTPPILIIQGSADTTVPLSQSKLLYDRLVSVGAPVSLLVVENGLHEFDPDYYQKPTTDEIYQLTVNFLSEKLRPTRFPANIRCRNMMIDPNYYPENNQPVNSGCVQPR